MLHFLLLRDDVTQWERYRSGGYGVVIAFDMNNLMKLADEQKSGTMLSQVGYDGVLSDAKFVDQMVIYFESVLDNQRF